jgi:D-alanyl-D-alanine carboxypeptidase/D-alanyl-D-alanine-endopeptidase (penicillin-binding protein 4)
VARPDTDPSVFGDGGSDSEGTASSPTPVDATDYVVRPGTGVVRPGTGVVRPGAGAGQSAAAAEGTAAKARAVVPDTPEKPLEPIHVVLPVIPVMPAKQGFLDRLVAPKDKRTDTKADKKAAKDAAKADRAAQKRARDDADPDDADDDYDDYDDEYEDEPEPVSPPPAPQVYSAQQVSAAAGVRHPQPASASARVEAPPAPPPTPPAPPPPPAPMPTPPAPVVPASPPAPAPVVRPPHAPAPAPVWTPPAPPPAPTPVWTPPAPPPAPTPVWTPSTPPPMGPPPMAPSRPGPPPGRVVRPGPEPRYEARPARRLPVRRRGANQYDQRRDDDRYERPRSRKGRWIVAGVLAAALASAVGAAAALRAPEATPSWVTAPVAAAVAPVLPGLGSDAPQPSPSGVSAILTPLLADGRLGSHVTASVVDVSTGDTLFGQGDTTGAIPASTAKLLTAAAVLHSRGPAYQIATRAVLGASPGEVVLIGGGDPTLAINANGSYPGAARLDLLAAQVIKALAGQAPTKVTIDGSLYSGPLYSPNWNEVDRNGGYITNVTALTTDGGRKDPKRNKNSAPRYPNPDQAAGQAFAAALGLPRTAVSVGAAPPGADQLGEVLSLPVSRMVEMMLQESDNMIAEAMARQVAIAQGKPASFAGAAEATREVLAQLKLPVDGLGLLDGSGLSNDDRVTAQLLTGVLAAAASPDHPELRSIVSGLPVAAYSGTLIDRYLGANPAAGTVRAKTGTLTGVDSLAGLAVDADGRLLAFSIVADATPGSGPAEVAIDKLAAAVASCGCR